MARPIYHVHVADGFVDDCDELIHRCSKVETLTYMVFCEIWKDLKFASIYQGRTLGAEISELSEEVIHVAKKYFVANTSNFEESVAGLFLVYGLLELQPFKRFAALRLVPDDIPAINRIQLVARRERRLDVLYILGKVLVQGPCQFHASAREYGLESSVRKYIEGCTSLDKQGVRPKGVFYRQNEELDMIRELNNLGKLYADAKAKITDGKQIDRTLDYTDNNLATKLDTSLKSIINGLINEDDGSEKEEGGDFDRSNKVNAIKTRAMKNVVDPIRHLTGIAQKRGKNTSPKNNSDVKKKPGKVKSGSPRKPLATGVSPKGQKRIAFKKKACKSKKRRKARSSSSESSENLSLASDDEDINDDVNLGKSDQLKSLVVASGSGHREAETEENATDVHISEDGRQVEVNLIPVVIHTEAKGQMIEIEILDQYNDTNNHYEGNIEEVKPINAQAKIKNLPEVSLKKLKPSVSLEHKNSSENVVILNQDFKRPFKPEKRELKKSLMKSKFKKMGILPVANFEDRKNK